VDTNARVARTVHIARPSNFILIIGSPAPVRSSLGVQGMSAMCNRTNLASHIAGCLALLASACAANPPPCAASAAPPPPPPHHPHCGPPPPWADGHHGPGSGGPHEQHRERGPIGPMARSADPHQGPVPEALEACSGKKRGDECVAKKDGWELHGSCQPGPGDNAEGPLACAPMQPPPPGGQAAAGGAPGPKPKK
jgi:hypothetical protein